MNNNSPQTLYYLPAHTQNTFFREYTHYRMCHGWHPETWPPGLYLVLHVHVRGGIICRLLPDPLSMAFFLLMPCCVWTNNLEVCMLSVVSALILGGVITKNVPRVSGQLRCSGAIGICFWSRTLCEASNLSARNSHTISPIWTDTAEILLLALSIHVWLAKWPRPTANSESHGSCILATNIPSDSLKACMTKTCSTVESCNTVRFISSIDGVAGEHQQYVSRGHVHTAGYMVFLWILGKIGIDHTLAVLGFCCRSCTYLCAFLLCRPPIRLAR